MNRREHEAAQQPPAPIDIFRDFVMSHTVEADDGTGQQRIGKYRLRDRRQLPPIDEVVFTFRTEQGANGLEENYRIELRRKRQHAADHIVYALEALQRSKGYDIFDDHQDEPIEPEIAAAFVQRIQAAEEAGYLTPATTQAV